ncbi:DUF1572 family protein [Mucilaginibacter sp. X5P1]|uniref:DUF1572 family protein n=1 Tax=Mucilaginibacter sp. X5P1 TaxID=2723088 RepID=UPI00161AE1EA|nr:DUF1572 family protein [Mucilaginibacter sp. X5P1]MBB6138843.1 hypothetical protein [Mucilaginibacter sp. X5P1]
MHDYLTSVKKRFELEKILAEKTFEQINDEALFWQYNEESNSIAIIVQHLAGNMLSRWTDFLTTDGEKPWRERDAEFENNIITRQALIASWDRGWDCLFNSLNLVQVDDLDKEIFIRNESHTVIDAINRQLVHVAYHVGQIVFIGKMVSGSNWTALTIPKGKSAAFNAEKFNK